jgi:hypothetical protein
LSSRSSLSLTLTHELQQQQQQQQVEATRAFFFQLDRGYSNAPGQRLCNGETVFSFPRKNRKKYKLFFGYYNKQKEEEEEGGKGI